MRYTHPNDRDSVTAFVQSGYEILDETGFDPAEDEFLDRHLAAIRGSLNDFRNQ